MKANMSINAQQREALQRVVKAVIDAVKEGGSLGVPGGILYAALMNQGCTLSQFESLMSALVNTGKLKKTGDVYFAV